MRFLACALMVALLACGSREDAGQPIVVEPPADDLPPDPDPINPPDEPPTTGGGDNLVIGDDPCTTDDDCVPADCCHPAACVAQSNAPSCGDVMCTMECRMGTLDCGGACLCHEGRCAARLSEALEGLPPPQ